MSTPRLLVLGTGGTIAGAGSSATGAAYRPGGLSLDVLVGHLAALGLTAQLARQEIARIGSQDIGFTEWRALHAACAAALADPAVDGIIITHGTDAAEETGFLLDLTLLVRNDRVDRLKGRRQPLAQQRDASLAGFVGVNASGGAVRNVEDTDLDHGWESTDLV